MKTIISKFYCIQPIQIEVNILSQLFGKKINLDKLNEYTVKNNEKHPQWKKIMDNLFNLYNSILVLDYKLDINMNIFKQELMNKEFLVNNKTNLSEFINEEDTQAYLLFDYRLFQFVIVYEISFKFPVGILNNIVERLDNNLDLYNCIRNIYVKEDNYSNILSSVLKFEDSVLSYINKFINDNFSTDINKNNLIIPSSSGNITNVVIMEELDEIEYKKYSKSFIDLNYFAERVPSNNKPIELDGNSYDINKIDYSKELYYFNGRFHSIILHSEKNQYRYIPIQFQMQYLWFYLSKQINLVLEQYNDFILNDDSISKISEYSEKIDLVINKVEILNIFNQKFKLSIEADNKIYNIIENRWNIEDMIKGSNNYINFFKNYLERLYNKKNSKTEERQNKILLFITLFQFIALLSVWNDYLSLLDDDIKNKADKVIHLFGNYHTLEMFNYYLPIVFVTIILFMIFYIYKSKE